MKVSIHRPGRALALRLLYGGLALGAVAASAACGSTSSSTAASSGTSQPAGSASPASSAPASSAQASSAPGITISARNVPGVGTVLVNGQGMTMYMLTSEKGGKITCTDETGCTKIWPDTELPKGVTSVTAGSGIKASLLGTVKNSAGELYATYNGWPLYTYAGDTGPGQAKGEAVTGFGGTWYVLNTSGNPVTSSQQQSGQPSSAGGY